MRHEETADSLLAVSRASAPGLRPASGLETIYKLPTEASEAAQRAAAQRAADQRAVDERFAGDTEALIVLAESALLALPSERSFHPPAAWADWEDPPRPAAAGTRDQAICSGGRSVGAQTFLVARRMLHARRRPPQRLLDPVLALAPCKRHPTTDGVAGDTGCARLRAAPASRRRAPCWSRDGQHGHRRARPIRPGRAAGGAGLPSPAGPHLCPHLCPPPRHAAPPTPVVFTD
jgi:hypothetical protein